MLCFKFPTGYRVMLRKRAGQRHVGATDRLIICCPFNPIFLKLFGVEEDWQPFLKARAQTTDFFFRRNYFSCGKSEFTSTIFPIIPVTSWRS